MRKMPAKWPILGGIVVFCFIIVDLFSNRTPFEVFISYLTFDSHTSYWRVLIFKFGMENVWAHPWFGLGLGDWARPDWMYTSSVDNFWLLMAMRHGILGFVLIFSFCMTVLIALMRTKPVKESVQMHRRALVYSFVGLFVAICTVHLWSATYVFMMFMLGAGGWFSDVPQQGDQAD